MRAAATECPTCLAVSRGGRIRLTEEGAELLDDLLRTHRQGELIARRTAIDNGWTDVRSVADRTIRAIDLLLEETARTREEMGWRDGQSEHADAEAAGTS